MGYSPAHTIEILTKYEAENTEFREKLAICVKQINTCTIRPVMYQDDKFEFLVIAGDNSITGPIYDATPVNGTNAWIESVLHGWLVYLIRSVLGLSGLYLQESVLRNIDEYLGPRIDQRKKLEMLEVVRGVADHGIREYRLSRLRFALDIAHVSGITWEDINRIWSEITVNKVMDS